MKKVGIALAVVLGAFVLLALAQLAASESGEVLVLETRAAAGETRTTRIWVVDDAGAAWVRGDDGSGWVQRLLQQPDVFASRGDERSAFRAVPDRTPAARDRVNALMREKYGFADRFIGASLGDAEREGALPIRLDPR